MRKIIMITITICFVTAVYTQNLVPNPYFDNDLHCPWNQCQIDFATGWSSYGRSPDYFHSCATNDVFSVPVNATGFQYPASGDAYAGMGGFNPAIPNMRELIGIELIEPLEIGTDYYVSFKANLMNKARYAINNLGVLFSTESYSIEPEGLWTCQHDSIPLLPRNYAHIYSDEIISDTANWTTISGWFTADSAYKYLIIGNFFDDESTDYIQMPFVSGQSQGSYYLIDDVYVGRYPTQINKPKQKSETKITVSPNPFRDYTRIEINNIEEIDIININLYDIRGIKQTNKINISKQNNNEFLIERNKLPNGMYFLQIKINNKIFYSKLLLTN